MIDTILKINYQQMFGNISQLEPRGGLFYEQLKTGKLFSIPASTTDEEINILLKKGINEKKDTIYEKFKKHEFKLMQNVLY